MALTVAVADRAGQVPSAPLMVTKFSVTFDNSYPAGGYDFDPAALFQSEFGYDKPPEILAVLAEGSGTHSYTFDSALKKLHVFDGAGVEISPAVNLSVSPGSAKVVVIAK